MYILTSTARLWFSLQAVSENLFNGFIDTGEV